MGVAEGRKNGGLWDPAPVMAHESIATYDFLYVIQVTMHGPIS